MKHLFLLCALLIIVSGLSAQTVYFSQDFNSSSVLSTYHGGTITANKFNSIAAAGNSYAEIVNSKLRIVKKDTTINSRVGVTRSTLFTNMPAAGAGLLKYSMEVTISGNPKNVPDGFLFSFGEFTGNNPNAPGAANIHSSLSINPTGREGGFTVSSNGLISDSLSGTQNIVWYINNSGAPVGYTGPDGILATVENDAADVWAVDANGTAKVLLEEVPASVPDMRLRNFKISNNPTFVAVLDIDNIILSEEPKLPAKAVVSVSAVDPVTVPEKTIFDKIPFPTQVNVTYDDGSVEVTSIRYSEAVRYNMYQIGSYAVTGTIIPNRGGINPNKIAISTSVIVKQGINLTNTFTPNGDGRNDVWIVPELQRYARVSVEIYDRDGKRLFQTNDPNIGWDGKNLRGEIISGSYFYIINVPALSLTKRGVLTVIK